jgi:hypothetical protein
MASSGSFNTSGYEGRYLTFAWSIKSQDVATNKTVISWSLKGAGGDSTWYKSGNFKVVIAGVTVYSSATRIQLSKGTTVASGTHTLVHNADGSKSFTASAEAGIYTTAVNCTGSGSFTLDTIPRASQPSLVTWPETTNDVGYFGEEFSIHMNRKSDAFTHTVRYAYGNRSGTIATGVTTGTTWAVPLSFMNDIPSSTSASGLIYVDTYNGSTKVGTKYTGFTVKVPASVKPSCSLTLEDVTGVDDIYGSPVQGLSKIKITVNTTPAYSSPIVSYVVKANGVTYSSATATTEALKAAGSSPVTVTVKDKRGRTGTASYTMSVQAYALPSLSQLTVRRCNADGTENDQGEYVRAVFSAAITSLNKKNTAAYKLRYKKSTDSSFTEVTLSSLANVYAVSGATYTFAADSSHSYDVEVEATDRHGTTTRNTSASTAFTLINWGADGTSMGVGKVAEKSNTLEVALDADFTGETRLAGNTYAFQPESFSGEKGYTLLAVITLNTLNVNAPIVFKINRRGALCPMDVYVRFASSSTTTDPDLASITYEGDNFGAFLYKEAASTWKLYVDNTSGWSNPCLQEWYTTSNQMARLALTFPSEQVADLPTPYYRATPAKMQSLLDYIYPVGSIYLSYSHVDPGTLFGGTWTRLQNAFLWATDASGTIGQTGGEKTHKLTVNELPAHDHGGTYTNAGTARTHAWLASGGSAMGYDTVETGGGAAHNNMPPYIHVSAWRRTA